MRLFFLSLLMTSTSLAGCANLDSIYRPLDLGAGISGVAVDVKQRGIYSTTRGMAIRADGASYDVKILCAEPSPDALSAYSASGGISALVKDVAPAASGASGSTQAGQVQAAFAAGESAASIGLRTQSIQLLRDGLFANCLAYMNNAVDQSQFNQLMRRSQDFTLGLLAIEQLTGAVKADQAALNTSSSAGTGSENVDKQTAAVDAALKVQNDAKTELAKAQNVQKDAQAALTTSQAKLDAATAAVADPANAADPAKKAAQDALTAATSDQASKKKDADAAQIVLDSDGRTAANADSQLSLAQDSLTAAQSQVRAQTSGSAQLAAAGGSRAAVADKVAAAVVEIVKTVLDASSRGETCSLLQQQAAMNESLLKDASFALLAGQTCTPRQLEQLATPLVAKGRSADALNFLLKASPKLVAIPGK